MLKTSWEPPAELDRDEVVHASRAVLARPDLPVRARDELFRLTALGLDWDVGGQVFEPQDAARIPSGPDGQKIGVFLLHGGAGDHRGKERMARFLAGKLGYRVVTMTYPGKLYLLDPSRDWPGDTLDLVRRTARTPLWQADEQITPDQYELLEDRSDPAKRAKWGTLFFLRAREGTRFYDRLAAWPLAFEVAMKDLCRRHFPVGQFTVYAHGHSTGGPFVHLLLQRVENVAGLLGMETSPFGALYSRMLDMRWDFPFTYLTIRTWRHIAKYAGAEAGPEGAWRLPWIMEDVLEAWERARKEPQLKAEYLVTYGALEQLAEAARAVARRLDLDAAGTTALVERYQGYAHALRGPGVKPVPPLLYGIARGSRDHTLERYQEVVLPALAALQPAPRARVVRFNAGIHGYEKPEDDLPLGVLPAVAHIWDEAIKGGYYRVEEGR